MCGLSAMITKNINGFTLQNTDTFRSLMYLSGGYRGADGAGVFCVENNGDVHLAKQANNTANYLATPEYKVLAQDAYMRGWALVGHNRHATRGVISDENSHPFVVDDKIVLVHNGSFNGSHKHLKDVDVDSEAIAHTIVDTPNIEDALKKIDAAYALIWYDVATKTINVIRNTQRPLWYMATDDAHVFSSEECFLNFVAEKHKLKIETEPYEIKESSLTQFTLNTTTKNTHISTKDIDTKPTQTNKWTYSPSFYSGTYISQSDTIAAYLAKDDTVMTQKQWNLLAPKYCFNTPVQVEINDILEVGETLDKNSYVLLGTTNDGNKIAVVADDQAFDTNTTPDFGQYSAVIKTAVWKRWGDTDYSKSFDEWTGIPLLYLYNLSPITTVQ